MRTRLALSIVILALSGSAQERGIPKSGYRDWTVYLGGPDRTHYSALDQINRTNVHRLQQVWAFDTGDAFDGSEMQCNPIIVGEVLYATTPKLRVIALDAARGSLLWSFDPNPERRTFNKSRNRGLTYWEDGPDKRIYVAYRHYLYSLVARTGRPAQDFGKSGRVDLREGFGRDPSTVSITASTPGVVYKNLLIMGSLVSEALPAAPGDIRAYDLRTGRLSWSFHTITHPGEFGYETWPKEAWKYIGGANNWSGMALDENRGLVFVPTGSAAFDFYGANRLGDNLFANSLIALRAENGKRVWHFQAVKHDVWDRDFPAPPVLVTIKRNGQLVDAVAQTTKSGHVYVFERETGKPLFPIDYRRVAQSDVDGEVLAETQPLPLLPSPFARQVFTEAMVTRRTPEARDDVLRRLRMLRSGEQFTPPSREGTIVFPGFDGGAEWGGPAYDPETGNFYVNSNEMAWVLRLVEKPPPGVRPSGKNLYLQHCASCHRADRQGTPPEFPSLVALDEKLTRSDISHIILEGSGRMSGFSQLKGEAARALADYLLTGKDVEVSAQKDSSPIDLKYSIDGYNKFLDPDGYPAVEPPWGTLNAINLDTGEIVWKIPFGEFPELVEKGIRDTGSENYGGPVVTAGGLIFIGATNFDRKFRVFDKTSGKLLWETTLPAAGNATPATYQVGGRQFVVIGAGGGKSGGRSGGSYVAFALPEGK